MILQNSTDIKTEYFTDKNNDLAPIDIRYEKHTINPNGLIQLQYIPSPLHTVFTIKGKDGVNVITYNKVENITNKYDFTVDYINGILTFHNSQINKEIQVSYTNSIGRLNISADRIFTRIDNQGSVVETLGTLLEEGRQTLSDLEVLGGATKVITEMEGYIESIKELTGNIIEGDNINAKLVKSTDTAKKVDTTLNSTIKNANNQISEMNEWVESHRDIVNLDNRVDETENKLTSVGTQLAEKAKEKDLDIERKRIDNIVALPPSVDNAETADIRVGANGKIYSSAGDSVRAISKGEGILRGAITDDKIAGLKPYKNLLRMIDGVYNVAGLTITIKENNISINGTATASIPLKVSDTNNMFKSGTSYTVSKSSEFGTKNGSAIMYIMYSETEYREFLNLANNTRVFTEDRDKPSYIRLYIASGATFDNYSFNIMSEVGNKATEFVPYCGISKYIPYQLKDEPLDGTKLDNESVSESKAIFTTRFALGCNMIINFDDTTKKVKFITDNNQAIIFGNVGYWIAGTTTTNWDELFSDKDYPVDTGTRMLVARGIGTPNYEILFVDQLNECKPRDLLMATVYFINGKVNRLFTTIGNFKNVRVNNLPYTVAYGIDDTEYSSRTTFSSTKIKSLIDNMTQTQEAINYSVPADVYLIDDLPLFLYKESMIEKYNYNFVANLVSEYNVEPFERVQLPNKESTCSLDMFNCVNKNFSTLNVNVVSKDKNIGKTIRTQHIGDSLTNRNIGQLCTSKLTNYGVTKIDFGTMTNGTVKGEGREGWTFLNFIGRSNIYLNNGKPITPQIEKGNGTTVTNPFIRLATDEDKANRPDWCFRNTGASYEKSYAEDSDKTGDFYIFDYRNYLTIHEFEDPEIVTIALSTNDISVNYNGQYLNNCNNALIEMVTLIKEAVPNVKIGIIPTPTCGAGSAQDDRYKKYIAWANKSKETIALLKTTIADLYLIPMWAHMPRHGIFSSGTDYIHWDNTGKLIYSNVLTSWIMHVI